MALDLGTLIGRVALETVSFDRTYVSVVRRMANLGVQAEKSASGTTSLDEALTGVAGAGEKAAAGLGAANKAVAETGVSASDAAVATRAATAATSASVDVTTRAGLASSKLTQAQLRASAAQERLTALQESGTATTRQLAAAQASLIAANDRVVLSQRAVDDSLVLGARSADSIRSRWAAIPGPVKLGAAALVFGAVEALKAATDYQKLTVNLVTGAGESQRNLKMVGDGMLHMAGQVGYGADTLAKAMFLVESAGFHGAAALTELKTAAEGAKVDNADLTTVVDALTSAMNAYHEPAAHAAAVTNTLIASAAVGKMHLQDLAASLGTVLPSAAALRVPLDQVGAALATMTMQGTNADRAATYLRFAFAALANPTSKAQKAMQAVGLTSDRVATTMTHGGLPAVFTLLESAVGQKFPEGSSKYLAALANMVGGTRGLQAVLELTGKNLTTMNRNLTSIQGRVKGAGNTVSDWADVQKNLNLQWSQFIDGLGAAGIKIGQDLVPVATTLLHVLNDTGHVVSEVTGFFEHDRTAADALAVVLLMTLEPALARVAFAAGNMVKSLVVGRIGAAGAALKGLGAAGLVSRVGIAAFAIEALNAAGDLRHLNDTANGLRATLNKPLAGSVLNDLNTQQQKLFASMSNNVIANMSDWQAFSTGLVHPVTALHLLTGASDDALKHMSDQINVAYGNFNDLVHALHGWPTPDAETQTAGVIKAMGLSAQDLATKNFPALLQSVNDWIAANRASHHPAEQAHTDIVALGSGALSAADEVKALTAALDLFAGNAISADQGAIAFANDIHALDKALKHSHGSLTLTTQAGRDARDAFDSAAQQALNTAEAQAKLRGGTDKARATLRDEIATLKAHAGNSDYAKAAIDRLRNALDNLPAAAKKATGALNSAGGAAKTAGRHIGYDFGHGMVIGLNDSTGAVDAQAAKLAMSAAAAAKRAHQSRSPSKVAMRIGRDFGAGLALGIRSTDGLVASAAAHVAHAATSGASGAAGYRHVTSQDTTLDQLLRLTTRATQDASKAAQQHAQTLADEASKAHQAAANMSGSTKAAEAAKKAAEAHARSLDQEARAAREASSALGDSNSGTVKALTRLVDAADKIAAKARTAAQNVSSAVLGDTGFGALGNQTDSFGNPLPGGGSPSQIIATLSSQQAALHKMRHRLRREHRHGLSYRSEEAIAALGLDTGGGIAATLSGATPRELRQITRLYAGIGKAGHGIGRDIAGGLYGQGIDRLIREQRGSRQLLGQMLTALRGDTRIDDTSIRRLAREIGKQFDPTIITDTPKQDHKQGQRVLAH